MASRLLRHRVVRAVITGTSALAAMGAGGCLIPQTDDVLDPITLRNHPPRIMEEQIIPNQRVVSLGINCTQEFSAFVEDPNVDDTLIARWYVDWEDKDPPVEEVQLTNNGAPRRAESVRYVANAWDPLSPLSRTGTHVVTLMVMDGPLGALQGPGSTPTPDPPVPGTDAGNPRYAVTHDWIVEVGAVGTPSCEPRNP